MSRAAFRLRTVVDGVFGENTYLAHIDSRDDCLVIDPGFDPEAIIGELRGAKWVPAAILNTHGHADHIAGNGDLKKQWPECPILIGEEDAPKLTDGMLNLSRPYGMDVLSPPADRVLRDGDIVSLAGFELEVISVPGHSQGHVVYLWKGVDPWLAFVGDVIFQGSIGRTDFPDGNTDQLLSGIRKRLYQLPDSTQLLPGHGPATTVGEEKRQNPFVRG